MRQDRPWFAAEQHYDNCIESAKARFPGVRRVDDRYSFSPQEEFERFTGKAQRERREALEGCSRAPW